MNKDAAIQRAQASRAALLRAIEGLSTGQRDTAPVEGIGSAKDLVGHICAWEESLARPLRGYLENGSFTPEADPRPRRLERTPGSPESREGIRAGAARSDFHAK